MPTRELIGKVIDNSGAAQAATDVWLFARGVATAKTTTDADGGFILSLGDEFAAGSYRLEALPSPLALGAAVQVELTESGPPELVALTVQSRGAVSAIAGWIFMLATIAVLALSTGLYLKLHAFDLKHIEQRDFSSPKNTEALSPDLSSVLAIAKEQVGDAAASVTEKGEVAAEELPAATQEALASSMAMDSLTAAEGIFIDLVNRRLGTLDVSKVTAVESLFAQAKKAGAANDLSGLEATIGHLETAVFEPEEPFFWSKKPEILLECLYWAFAATLIRLIFNSGYYLYKRRFLATAIPHHIAVAVSVPILAVLIGFFLSLVRVSLSLSEIDLVLDMSNVYIVILVAALIGFSPWKAWDFIQELADLLFKKLGEVFKADPADKSTDPSNG